MLILVHLCKKVQILVCYYACCRHRFAWSWVVKEVGIELLGLEIQGIRGLDLRTPSHKQDELNQMWKTKFHLNWFQARALRSVIFVWLLYSLATMFQLFILFNCDRFADFMMSYNVSQLVGPKLGNVNWPMCSYASLGPFHFLCSQIFIHIMLGTDAFNLWVAAVLSWIFFASFFFLEIVMF